MFCLRTLALTAALAGFGILATGTAAHANMVSNFTGTCAAGNPGPQGLCTGTATGVLTLTDSYVWGTDITAADFVSFSYKSTTFTNTLDAGWGTLYFTGGFNADGSINGTGEFRVIAAGPQPPLFQVVANPQEFSSVPGGCYTGAPPVCSDGGFAFTFSPFTHVASPAPVPEPSSLALLAVGLGLVMRRRQAERKR